VIIQPVATVAVTPTPTADTAANLGILDSIDDPAAILEN
jgi:hypothetical protein